MDGRCSATLRVMLSGAIPMRGASWPCGAWAVRSAWVTTVSMGPRSPVDLLAKSVTDIDRDSIHQERHGEQDCARGGGIGLESLVGSRHPVEHLDGHDGKGIEQPLETDVRE